MPKGAVLVNTARKEMVNEVDLLRIFEPAPILGMSGRCCPGLYR